MKTSRFYTLAGIVGAVVLPAVAVAELLDLHQFAPGTPISSSEMNENFADLNHKLSDVEDDVAAGATALRTSSLRLIEGAACVWNENAKVTDCTCEEGEIAISGGAAAGSACMGNVVDIIAESGPLTTNPRIWRLVCERANALKFECCDPRAFCLRVQ
jgi:hypothetical protein